MQGSLLDRIDENIEVSVVQVKNGVEALGKVFIIFNIGLITPKERKQMQLYIYYNINCCHRHSRISIDN